MVDLDYRPCVGIMLLDVSGRVWMGCRSVILNDEYSLSSCRWQMPQGGIDCGEDSLVAARRELWEETGVRSVELLGSIDDWLYYDLPVDLIGTALRGRWRGQKQRWYAFRFVGCDSEINISNPPSGSAVEFDEWEWVLMDDVVGRVVDFKRGVYERVVSEFSSLA